tara:strand:- start:543 stop:755 length:213 start_codon:yes stop_codon:yes gene_type:complete
LQCANVQPVIYNNLTKEKKMAKVTVTFDFDDDDINFGDIAEHVREVLYSSQDVYELLYEAEISVIKEGER